MLVSGIKGKVGGKMPGAGAPIGSKNAAKGSPWYNALKKACATLSSDANGNVVTALDAAALALVSAAIAGDITAAKELGDRLDGKAVIRSDGSADQRPIIMIVARPQISREEWIEAHAVPSADSRGLACAVGATAPPASRP